MIISRTPLRVSFVGGGTDLPSFCYKERGAVVSTAIKKYVYIAVHPNFNDQNLIAYSRIEKTSDVDQIQNPLIRESMKLVGIRKGIGINSMADIPSGTGMGSSSSFTVGLLNALYAYRGIQVGAERLAEEACRIEIDLVKEPIGRQDQYAAAIGGLNKFEFRKDGVKNTPLVLDPDARKQLEYNLMLFYIGGQRNASDVLTEQNHNLEKRAVFDSHLKMRDLADLMAQDLMDNKIDNFGKFLHENWLLKRSAANSISTPEIDACYQTARDAGAEGGKLLGAGGCGFLLLYADASKQSAVRQAMKSFREYEVKFDIPGSKIVYSSD